MSDYDLSWLDSYDQATKYTPDQADKDQAGWLDVPKEVGATVAGTLAAPLGAAQVATATAYPNASQFFKGLGQVAHGTEESLRESETPVSRRAAEAKLFPGEGEESFMAHPIRSAIMQGAGLAGFGAVLAGVAAVAPEGLLAGLVSDAAAGGVLGAAGVADKVAQYYNDPELTDKKLAAQDPRFKQMIDGGVDPKEARNIVMQDMVHASPVLANGLAGAAGMGVGGRILRRATGGSGGVASRMALGGAENAVGMGGMGLAGSYADQDMEIAQGKRTDYDWRKMWMAAANNAAMGGVIGAGAGVLHKPDGRRVDRENVTNTAPIIEHTDDLAPPAADTAAIKGEPIPDPAANLAPYAAPGSKPLEPTGAKSQGVASDERAALDAAQGREPVTPKRAPAEHYTITDPLTAKTDGETLGVRVTRNKDGSIGAYITDDGHVIKATPREQNLPAEEAIAWAFGDHPPNGQADPSKVKKDTPTPEVPVVHPGEPEAPVAAVVHPEAEKVAPDVTRVDTSEVGPRDSAVQTDGVKPVAPEETQAGGNPRVLNDLTKPEVTQQVTPGITHAQHLVDVHAKFPSVFDKLGSDQLTADYADQQHKATLAHETETMEKIYGKEDWKKLKSIERRLDNYQTGQQADELTAQRNAITDKYHLNEDTDKIEGGVGYPDEALPSFWKGVKASLREIEGGRPKDLAHSLRTAMRDLPTTTDWEKIPEHQKVNLIQADAALRELKKHGVSERDALKRAFIEGVARDGNDARELFQGDLERFKSLRAVEEEPSAPQIAAPKTPTAEPRVLNDLTKPEVSVTNEDMARNLAQVKAEEAAAARREAGPQPGHATQKKLDQEAKNLEIATRVHASHPPMHPDDFKINNQANRDILKNRLQEQISDALASGVGVVTHEKGQPFENRIPGKVGAKPGPVMWLADAQRMLRKLNNKTAPKLKEIQEFLHSEYQGHQGEWGTLAVRRKSKGQEFGDAKKRAQELKGEDKPSIENLAAEGDAGEVRTHEQSPEDTLLSHETEAEASDEYVDTGKPSEAQIEKLKELDALAAEAKKSEEPAYTAGSNRTVPIERGRDRFAGMRPKVVKAIKLAEKIKKDANDIRLRKEPGDAALHGEILEAAKGSVTTTHSTEEPIRSSTLGEELKKLDAKNVAYGLKGFQKMMYPIFKNRLMAHAKDVTVHIVTREQMKRLTKEDVGGFWSEEHNHIVMVDKLADDPQKAALYLIHEGIHAAYAKVLEADPFLQDRIHRMMDVVHDYLNTNTHLIKDEKDINELTYGLTDAHEFVAEAFSNRRFQELLSKIEIPQKLAKELGMEAQRKFSMWDVFVNTVRHALKMPKGTHSMLEGALRVAQELEGTRSAIMRDPVMRQELRMRKEFVENPEKMSLDSERSARDNILEFARGKADTAMGVMTDPAKALQDKVADAMYAGRGIRSTLGKAIRYVETNDQFRQRVEKFWPGFYEQNTVRRVFDTIQKQGVHAVNLMKDGHAISTRMARAYKRAPGAFSRFANLVHEATVYGFDPASDIGKRRNAYLELNQKVQAKIRKGVRLEDIIHDANAEHISTLLEVPRLREEYANLVGEHPEFAKLMDDTFKYFDDAQQEMSRGYIQWALRSTLKGDQGAEHNIKRRADELLQAKKSDAHKQELIKELGGDADAEKIANKIYEAKSLSGREGPYAPLMRHGDWVVHGRYKFKAPTNAIQKVGPSSFEFASKKEAVDFARSSGLDARYDTAYYDPATGEKSTKAKSISTAGSGQQRWVVHLNDRHVEFHTSKKNALKAFDELNKTGHFESLNAPEVRNNIHLRDNELGAGGESTLIRKLEQSTWYEGATADARQSAKAAIHEAALSMMGGQSMQSRRMARRNIAGYSDNLIGNFDIYNRSQANFRAKQEFRPQIDAALRDLQEHVEKGPYEKNTPEHTLRSEYLNEIQQRARAPDPNDYTGKWADFTRQLSTWSYIYRMGRISHLLLHQTHLPMITAPTIAGRHNLFRAYGATMHAWKELTGAYKKGIVEDAFKALSDSLHEGTDYSKWIRETTRHLPDGERLHKLFATLEELGWVHPQYEVEIQRHLQSQQAKGISGSLLRGMNHFDTVFRHATNATEMINRYAGSMAAYRLEFAKLTREGKSKAQAHDLAVEYARNTLANTQGVYSSTNAAPIFKQKILRPFLQFKQFPQMIYNLMAGNLIKAAKGGTTRERVEALSSFAYLVGAHTIMTGALGGVPLESAKIVATVGKGLNILPGDWSDVERWQYDKAVNLLGKDYADWVMHGLSRALGIDAHHRLGLNSFFTFGLPEGANSDSKSVWAWLGQQALGAPGGLGADALSAVSKIASGDVGGGFEKLAPQQIRDIYRAWNGGTKDYKYGAGETVARVLGFTPSGEAEHGERKAEARSGVESYNKEYRSLVRKWIESDNKADVWKRIQKWNEGKAKDSQITLKQLTDAAKRKKKAEDEGDTVEGIRVNKRTRFIAERANAIY